MTVQFITRYNYKPMEGLKTDEKKYPSRTYQEGKTDADINLLYKRYLSKGFTPSNIKNLEARYGDISYAQTHEELLNIMADVKQMFNDLPSEIRSMCNYSVDDFIEVITKPQEDEENFAIQNIVFDKLGMLERKEKFEQQQTLEKPAVKEKEAEQLAQDIT